MTYFFFNFLFFPPNSIWWAGRIFFLEILDYLPSRTRLPATAIVVYYGSFILFCYRVSSYQDPNTVRGRSEGSGVPSRRLKEKSRRSVASNSNCWRRIRKKPSDIFRNRPERRSTSDRKDEVFRTVRRCRLPSDGRYDCLVVYCFFEIRFFESVRKIKTDYVPEKPRANGVRHRARPKPAVVVRRRRDAAAPVCRRLRQRREDVRVHAEQQEHPGRHHGVGLQPVRLPSEQQLHGAGTGHMLRQLPVGLVHRRRQRRERRVAVAAVPPGTDAVPGRVGRRRQHLPQADRQGRVGGHQKVRLQHRSVAHRRGAGHVQLHRQRTASRRRSLYPAEVHTGHRRRRDYGQRSTRQGLRRRHSQERDMGGRRGLQRKNQPKL